ncbi:OB-fold nucleic acid binding domain-containing protein [Spongisporangium articulatum]|uniref:OB-fold nucleic acid binding domain-containing protein n=1 Tax=Spongisporangium articulatum TaxID=3362603 RepID=A0ABW8ATD4_9ACTN
MGNEPSGLRKRFARLVAPQHQVHAEQEREESARLGGTPIDQLTMRQPAMVCGTLRSVTLRPRGGVPALVAELYDGTGSVSVVWLGRRQISGIECGRRLRVKGLVTEVNDQRVIYNPRYELVATNGC